MFCLLVVGRDLSEVSLHLQKKGYEVVHSLNGFKNSCDLALVDLEEDTSRRLKLVRELAERGVKVVALFEKREEEALRALKEGAEDVFPRQASPELLILKIERLLRSKQVEEENVLLRSFLFRDRDEEFILETRNEKFRQVLETAKKVADAEAPVLIKGETGVGKEVLARYIHRISSRRDKPFVVVDCSAIPEELFESELFGYEKGAFTGATKKKPGLVEIANKGTLFLDEIGDMPLALQAKLLRFVETKRFRRVGGLRDYRVDVRIICATNKDLRKLISEGRFREDLYYRINTVELEVPPLRERKEDIPLLVNFFLKKWGKKIGERALQELVNYRWEGNIRELKNLLERAALLSDSEYVDEALCLKKERKICAEFLGDNLPTLRELELKYTLFLYERFGGDVEEVARVLGCSKRTVFRKLREARERGLTD